MRLPPAVLVAAMLASLPSRAAAQAVRGIVVDDSNLSPVAGAMVRLVVDGELGNGRETDDEGRFFLAVDRDGEYQLEVARLGYATTRSQPFTIVQGDTLDVEFRVLPDAVLLAPITVTARSNRGRDLFERRREEWGRGIFLGPDEIAALAPDHPAKVLKGLENVDVRWGWGLSSSGMPGPIPSVRTVQGRGCVLYMVDYVPVRESLFGGGDWAGYQLGSLGGEDIVAVEVYRSVLEVPKELQRYTYRLSPSGGLGLVHCGLVVFWTGAGW